MAACLLAHPFLQLWIFFDFTFTSSLNIFHFHVFLPHFTFCNVLFSHLRKLWCFPFMRFSLFFACIRWKIAISLPRFCLPTKGSAVQTVNMQKKLYEHVFRFKEVCMYVCVCSFVGINSKDNRDVQALQFTSKTCVRIRLLYRYCLRLEQARNSSEAARCCMILLDRSVQ